MLLTNIPAQIATKFRGKNIPMIVVHPVDIGEEGLGNLTKPLVSGAVPPVLNMGIRSTIIWYQYDIKKLIYNLNVKTVPKAFSDLIKPIVWNTNIL
jgi:hypothetical protein